MQRAFPRSSLKGQRVQFANWQAQYSWMILNSCAHQAISANLPKQQPRRHLRRLIMILCGMIWNTLPLYLCSPRIARIIDRRPPITAVIVRAISNNHCDYSNSAILLAHRLWKFRSHDIHYATKLYASTLVTRSST